MNEQGTAITTTTNKRQLATETIRADENPVTVYLARQAEGSKRTLADALVTIACMLTKQDKRNLTNAERESLILRFPWHEFKYQYTQALRAKLQEAYAPATVNKMLTALRGVITEAWNLRLMTAEDRARACAVKTIRFTRVPSGRALSQGELRSLFQTCSKGTPGDTRDAALMALLYGAGLRRAEVVSLNLSDYDPATGALTLVGKGNKQRIVYATNGAKDAMDRWLALRGDEPGPLFFPINKGGRPISHRMTDQAIYALLKRRATLAGVRHFSPHDLRRSFISHLLDAGADLVTVQKLAGHASPETTSQYDRRGEEAKKHAAEMLHVPC